ncbi:glycosyltransferase family 4 protein [Sulfuricurvum sp.]|uniref:glycosyltransferase family 4 protein n=1 Tax=Sulfuricurvum sp. TaxID=2025608 RepID=UPI0026132322|nr:MraY family glycosyltransferase [Sulfuricurvum sp.]MDD4950736.1 MraY family glycosyltransferase [Sulfuricurvum sp.]
MITSLLLIKIFISFIASFIFIQLIIHFAPKLDLVDIPNHRSMHKHVTPRGAGIGIIFGVILSDILTLNPIVYSHIIVFFAIFMVFIIGVLDDHRDTAPKTKFIIIFIATLLLYLDHISINTLGRFFGYDLSLGWFALPFTMFAVAGFTNALNLTDGLDGLAGGISIIILGALCSIGYEHHDLFIVSVSLSFIAAIAAFLILNWHPAKIFMGDSGSLTLGFVISVLSIKALPYMQPTSILFLAALPIMDTLIVMIRRKRHGYSMFTPDKLHLHHIILNFFQGDVKKTVFILLLLQGIYSVMGIDFSDYPRQRYTLLLYGLNVTFFYMILNGMIAKQNPFSTRRKIRKKRN